MHFGKFSARYRAVGGGTGSSQLTLRRRSSELPRHRLLRWGIGASLALFLGTTAFAASPLVNFVTPPLDGTYSAKNPLPLIFHFNQTVVVTGTPTYTIQVGSTTRQFAYAATKDSEVDFTYQPVAGDNGVLSFSGPFSLNGGTIRGLDGSDAAMSFSVPSTNIVIDTAAPAAPVIQTVTPASPIAGQSFKLSGTAEPKSYVAVKNWAIYAAADGSWTLPADPVPAGAYTYRATATDSVGNVSPPGEITFTVQPDPTQQRPVVSNASVTGEVEAPITPVQVSATNNPFQFTAPGLADYGLAISKTGQITGTPTKTAVNVDIAVTADNGGGTSDPATIRLNIGPASAPVITSVVGPANGTYNANDHYGPGINIWFDKPIFITGSPTITVTLGGARTEFSGALTNGTDLVFSHPPTAQGGSLNITGPINLNGGTIKDADGRDAVLSFTPVDLPGVIIDRVPPAPPVITAITPSSPTTADSFTISGTAEPLAGIIYDMDNGAIKSVKVDANGKWSVTFAPMSAGDHIFAADAVDAAGNSAGGPTGMSAHLKVTVQPASPPPPSGQLPQTITFSSPTGALRVGQPVTLGATSSSGLPITYTVVAGDATIAGNVLTPTSTASLTVRASSAGNATYAAASTDVNFGSPQAVPMSRLVNMSSRLRVSANDSNGASIAGFVVTGTSPKQVLIRAVGPTLSAYGVSSPLPAPQLKLFDGKNALMTTNAGWADNAQIASVGAAVGAFPLAPGSQDAALLMTLAPGSYTAQVQSAGSGTALIEVYDAATPSATPTNQLINISARGTVGDNDDVLIGGFVVAGDSPKRVLVRGVGPGLKPFGVPNTLADPVLTLYDSHQVIVAENDNWGTPQPLTPDQTVSSAADVDAASTHAGAFALPSGSTDAALVITLSPGSYSAIVTGANHTTGVAMVEIYEVP